MSKPTGPLLDILLWPLDWFYALVCRELECPYCTFYRGVIAGLVAGLLTRFLF